MKNRNNRSFMIDVIVLCLIVLCLTAIIFYSSAEIVKIKVTEKERIATGYGKTSQSKYLIFTETEVFENTDDVRLWKFNSSDLYSQLKVGNEYTVKVIGWRFHFFSWYRNIYEIKKR